MLPNQGNLEGHFDSDENEFPTEIEEEEARPPGLTPVESYDGKSPTQLQRSAILELSTTQVIADLSVRAIKGERGLMTANLANTQGFNCLAHKPDGEFQEHYQILCGGLEKDRRLANHLQPVWFVPAFCWRSRTIVLFPVKGNQRGRDILYSLKELEPEFPNYQAYVQCNSQSSKLVVRRRPLSNFDAQLAAAIMWPTVEDVLVALGDQAFDDFETLSAANPDVRCYAESQDVD